MPSARHLIRNGDYLRLMTGGTISSLGSVMSAFVFTLLAVAISGSPVQAGLVGMASALGGLLTALPAGALVDRLSRKKVLVTSGLVGTVLYGSVAVAGWLDHLTIAHLAVVAFGSGAGYSFFMPAQIAALRLIVAPEDIGTAMAANEGRAHVATLVGAPLGGALYSVGRVLPIVFDALSYLVLTVLLVTIRRPLPAPEPDGDEHEPMHRAIGSGLKWLFHQPAIRAIALSATLVNFGATGTLLILVVSMQQRGVHASTIGLLETGMGVGGLLGAFVAPRVISRVSTGAIAIAAGWVLAITFSAVAFTTVPAILIGLLFTALLLLPSFNSALFGYQALVTPDGMQGRAQSAIGFLANGVRPLAPVLAGVLLTGVGARSALLVFGGILGVASVGLTLSRPIRTIPLLSTLAEAEST
jgi:predicted MFS family arabinose efflux permease